MFAHKCLIAGLAIGFAMVASSAECFAHRPSRPSGHMGRWTTPFNARETTASGSWSPLKRSFPGKNPDTALLMTDGSVLMHDECTPNWYTLHPNQVGDYINGSWDKTPTKMPNGYSPLYFASTVITYGAYTLINGGEYDGSRDGGTCSSQVESASGAFYDHNYNEWSTFNVPGWKTIGDAPAALLTRGNDTYLYMLGQSGDPNTKKQMAWSWTALRWESKGKQKGDPNEEEGWTLLQDGNLLTVDTNIKLGKKTPAELYDPNTDTWTPTATAQDVLVDQVHHEIGPAVVLASGHVLQIGASPCGDSGCRAHTGIYLPETATWIAGPDFPKADAYYDSADGPAALLINGRVLLQASPGYGFAPSRFFEFDEQSNSLSRVSEPASAPCVASFQGRMLELPSGQILWSSDNRDKRCQLDDVEVYTPKGTADPTWKPSFDQVPVTLTRGTGYVAKGYLFMGLSQGAAYGDDAQMATNYPIITITNSATGHVCFAKTSFWFGSGNWTQTETETEFDVPNNCETGAASLRLIANGISSDPVSVQVL